MEKYLEELANHQRFMKLCDEIVELNERICDVRPVPEVNDDKELTALKKKLQQRFMAKYKLK